MPTLNDRLGGISAAFPVTDIIDGCYTAQLTLAYTDGCYTAQLMKNTNRKLPVSLVFFNKSVGAGQLMSPPTKYA